MQHPGPDRVQRRLDQQQRSRLDRRDEAHAGGEQIIGQSNLEDAQIENCGKSTLPA